MITGLDVKRYFLRASKFGWLPQMLKWGVTAPATRIGFKLVRTGVIEGRVLDADGEGQANATVVALPSAGLGNAGSPIIWAVDGDGKFAQDRFEPGTYYLWARRGEMLVFPPEKIEISDGNLDARIELRLSHKGARVRGRIITRGGTALDPDTRAVLFGQSPLALPRKAVGEIDHDGVLRGRRALAGALRDLGAGRHPRPPDHQRPARSGDPDRARAPRSISRTPSSSARRPRSESGPRSCRTRMRLRQSASTWWLSFSKEVKRTAIPETARLVPPCVKLMK